MAESNRRSGVSTLGKRQTGTPDASDLDASDLDEACEAAMAIEGAPLTGLALVIVSGGNRVYEGYFGSRRLASKSGEADLPFDAGTRLRAASISKPVTALGLMRLVENGGIDLDLDISDYLGFRLRNPYFPDSPITTRMLLGHVSSLRDAGFYYPPLGARIAELFEPGGRYWAEGAHFARSEAGADLSPGHFYSYCNLGYGLIGTMMERAAGERFDRYMDREIFKPLGLDAGFNPALLGSDAFRGLSPIYRKCQEGSEDWDPEAVWRSQIDDYPGERPKDFVRRKPGSEARLEDYIVGSNGSLFSPQGGMRICARDLGRIAQVFLCGGEAPREGGGQGGAPRPAYRVVSAAAIQEMAAPVWRRGAPASCAEPGSDQVLATGSGLMLTAGPHRHAGIWGHHGSAGGTSRDPEKFRSSCSGISVWEEGIREAAETVIDRF
ncbi:MAG: serine hydrolase [Spirochaetes bacterium]|nr:serine hydrolase [Spirochaetota bacterium]